MSVFAVLFRLDSLLKYIDQILYITDMPYKKLTKKKKNMPQTNQFLKEMFMKQTHKYLREKEVLSTQVHIKIEFVYIFVILVL